MTRARALISASAVIALALAVASCSSSAGVIVPSAHYVYPNSNVELLGAVSATKSKTGFFATPGITMDELEALYRSALAQKSGDVLVNGVFETKTTMYPFFLTKAKFSISGTAAKMSVGRQKLAERQDRDLRALQGQAAGTLEAGGEAR
jgi:hypothetical protein